MAAYVPDGIGNATRLITTGGRKIRSTPVDAADTRPMLVTAPSNLHSPQHHLQQLGFLESARMEREMAREIGQTSQQRSQKSAMSIMAALLNMSNRRFFVLVAGVVLLVGGLLALRFPVFLPEFDHWGFQINCGSGFQSIDAGRYRRLGGNPFRRSMPHSHSDASRLGRPSGGGRYGAPWRATG
jgi:hypothetical protein